MPAKRPRKGKKEKDRKALVLEAALPGVAFDGWTEELLARAGSRLRLGEDGIAEIFPEGALGLVKYFSEWADEEMLARLPEKKLAPLKVRARVALAVRARLELLAPHKQAVSQALSFLAPPPRNIYLAKMVWKTADAIWRRAGDTATDFNHYTKRLLLAGVLTSTTLYWLNDRSAGHEKTWAFLDRRIGNVLAIGRRIGKIRPGGKAAQ